MLNKFTSLTLNISASIAISLVASAVQAQPFRSAEPGERVHRYQIQIGEQIETANIEICFEGKAPEYLSIESKRGNRDLIKYPQSKQGRIEIQGRYWKTKFLPNNACLDYSVSLKRHHAKRTKESKSRKNIAYIETNTWLWLPETSKEQVDISLSFELPKWASISAPWQRTQLSKKEFLMGPQPQDWGYTLLIGDFEHKMSPISPGHYLNIATMRELPKKDKIISWLTNTAQSLENYLGDYPTAQTQIIVIAKTKMKQGPVPWGDFSRGNGFGIRFVIVPGYDIQEFYNDWTVTHEFSHQLLPKIHYDDIWLSEGLSSYLQYVLMGQSGILQKDKAWHRIYKGLQRGEKGTKKVTAEPLKETSGRRKSGGRSGRTMRIYWSGALYFLQADLALRQQSEGKVGLNQILLKLNRCCINGEKIWRGQALANKLDQLSETKIFGILYRDFSNSEKFPKYQSTFKQLGIAFSNTNESNSKVPNSKSLKLKIKQDSFADKIMDAASK
ncbi:MAG: hypothetical protein KUG78_03380 [Kangiellaceae bacterium]|nr:hypothetical protein [Kangiellaceae bacterium]